MRNPIFCALDVDSVARARELAKMLTPFVGGFKVGPRLLLQEGARLISELSEKAQVFVDCKYFDIPNTTEASLRAVHRAGASFATVHSLSGPVALRHLAQVESELNAVRPFRILAVTLLTSFNQDNLPPTLRGTSIAEQVLALAESAVDSGLSGLVCSPAEVAVLRKKFPEAYIVTPGIRFQDGETHDQSRVSDPETALRLGASALVVGRPIVDAKDPVNEAQRFSRAVSK